MNAKNKLIQMFTLAILTGVLFLAPKTADAGYGVSFSYSSGWGGGHHGRGHGHGSRHGWGGGHGHRHHNDFVFVNYVEPRPYFPGRIYSLPRAAKFVWVDGERYYFYQGLYYQPSYYGDYYDVVPDPYLRPQVNNTTINHIYQGGEAQPAQDTQIASTGGSDFDVNFRNNKGEMVTVKIRKTENGYLGPQGEFYPEFPKVAQLKEMYAK